MADKIREARPEASVRLVGESDKLGMFIVVANSTELWNKYETGEFPEPDAIIALLPKPPTS